jgi:hypothetical protein
MYLFDVHSAFLATLVVSDCADCDVTAGSYAVEVDGAGRTREVREMVQGLHGAGLRVVLDVVYNHSFNSGACPTCQQRCTLPFALHSTPDVVSNCLAVAGATDGPYSSTASRSRAVLAGPMQTSCSCISTDCCPGAVRQRLAWASE